MSLNNAIVKYTVTCIGLLKRGKELQRRVKSKHKLKPQEKSVRLRSDVQVLHYNIVIVIMIIIVLHGSQISCCYMEQCGKKKGFTKASPMFEVDLNKFDSYDVVVRKICSALAVDCKGAALLTARGSVIPQATADESWTLATYLGKRRTAPDKLQLGVGILEPAVRKFSLAFFLE